MNYDEYAALVPADKLCQRLDEEHLGDIADVMDQWETKLAPALGLKPAEINDIKAKYMGEVASQRWALEGKILNNLHNLYEEDQLKSFRQKYKRIQASVGQRTSLGLALKNQIPRQVCWREAPLDIRREL